ncbi:dockerin type I domain-containing protein [Rubripirellula tenax]|nr:dockerin type I domain-containing protein [Rubripirellula tenax]
MLHKKKKRRRLIVERLESRALLAAGIDVALYEFTTHDPSNGVLHLFSSDTHASTTASDITSSLFLGFTGNGDPPRGLALGGAFDETSEPTPAGGQNDYLEFTIAPDAGFELSLSRFAMQVRKNDPNSKDSYSVYFDNDPGAGGDNFTTKILSQTIFSEDIFETLDVDLESVAMLANQTTPITFRVYSWGTVGLGTARLDNIRVQAVAETSSGSIYAYYGDSERLINPLDELGNRVADFSTAGYKYGNSPIPDVTQSIAAARVVNVSPIAGDNTAHIQAAIDQVEAMSLDANGFRGIVQLGAGDFPINDQVNILGSGVVLRGVGDGDDPLVDTILRGTGTAKRSLVVVGPSAGFASGIGGTTHNIVDKYVPVGATSFNVDSTTNWSVGDPVVVRRPSTADWIADIGMDSIPPRSDGSTVNQWAPGSYDQLYERVITRIEGDRVFLNAPLMNAFELQYGGGTIFRYTFPRINNVGIENIRGKSDFVGAEDEDHANTFIELQAVEDAWVSNVTGQHFVFATVHATSRSIRVTVDDAQSLDPVSIVTGGRRYPFNADGQFILMKNLYSEFGRHDFVNNARTRNRGPNVFLDAVAVNSFSSTGPHQSWSTGTLYDTVKTDNLIEARNRGNFGSGHGWGGANFVFWNTVADTNIVQNPPTAQNWLIGAIGSVIEETRFGPQPSGNYDSIGSPIDFGDPNNPTNSLYVAQRNEANSYADTQLAEYVIGDYDLGAYDSAGSVDTVIADPAWLSTITANTSTTILSSMDGGDQDGILPISFAPQLTTNEVIVSALVSIGIRDLDDATTGEVWIDSVADRRSFASLGILASPTFNRTQTVTLELTGAELSAFADGRLDLAVSDAVVDWLNVQLVIGEQTALIEQTVQDGTRVLVEEFDNGGPFVAYYDSTQGNAGGQARPDEDVDLYAASIVLGNIADGEWLEFSRDIVPGVYDIDVRAWSTNANPKGVRILIAENSSTQSFTELGSIDVPDTGNERLIHTIESVDLTAWGGEDRVLRVEFYGSQFGYDWLEFTNTAASVAGRSVAYRGAGATYGEGMTDPNKSALRGYGAAASMANYTNYSRGLNRVIVDIDNLPATTLAASDFEFRVGNTEDFGNNLAWTSMPSSAIDVAPLAGTTKRVTIDWPHQAIMNKWLEVTIKANANTGLTQNDVFYFGNQVGDINGSTSASKHVTVNAFDTLGVRFNQSPTSNSVGIDNIYDIDRNGSVNAFDTLGVRFNQMPSGGLMMITLPPAAAPVAASFANAAQQNPNNALDVNGDGQVTALDALMGINFLGQTIASSELTGSARRPSSANFYDVNGDGLVTALDSLRIINKLGRSSDQLAEQMFIPQLESISDDLDWVSDRQRQQVGFIDLALIAWN